MATFGSFAGLAAGAMGALSSSEMQLLGLYDYSASGFSPKSSSEASPPAQDSNHRLQTPAQRSGLLSRFALAKLAPEFNGIGCFDTVFGWQSP
ncbi:hypothetical protein GOP47_0007458 [Adiantum capillus-veneris]|uniref:Uncharacterized protein n=1 Tax=Adiantum capillus-veneris TaxID=13818 RepID=A0A9D4ZJB5_ADICA|nr:hypothetical protein GOP47_0007458 [Adiantum capillus-veneris]